MAIRITGGSLGGRFVQSPDGRTTRPTSAITRQALFNILSERVDDALLLDLYAGSGVISIEALSRGARRAILVDKGRPAVQLIQRNLKDVGLLSQTEVLSLDVAKLAVGGCERWGQFSLIYADPPFTEAYPDLRSFLSWLAPEGVAIFEMPSRQLPEWASEAYDLRKYGESTLAFFAAPNNC